MTRHCYDTSVLIGILRDEPRALDLICGHEDAGEGRATTAITSFELSLGANGVQEKNSVAQLLESMEGLELSMSIGFIAGQNQNFLISEGRSAPLRDLLIGTIASELGWTLHTFDKRFPKLDGLDLRVHNFSS